MKIECEHKLSGSQKPCGCLALWELSSDTVKFYNFLTIRVCDLHVTNHLDKKGKTIVKPIVEAKNG
jgi:hypothetical protein